MQWDNVTSSRMQSLSRAALLPANSLGKRHSMHRVLGSRRGMPYNIAFPSYSLSLVYRPILSRQLPSTRSPVRLVVGGLTRGRGIRGLRAWAPRITLPVGFQVPVSLSLSVCLERDVREQAKWIDPRSWCFAKRTGVDGTTGRQPQLTRTLQVRTQLPTDFRSWADIVKKHVEHRRKLLIRQGQGKLAI
jgi:hypothetical protein